MPVWFSDIIRGFIKIIDTIVYWFIEVLVALFDALSKIKLFDDNAISGFANRVYIFIAIVMVFKVSFSIIQFIINPDTFNDNEKGMGKIIQNVILVLVALVAVRHVFTLAYDFQNKVVESNIVPTLVLGDVDALDPADIKRTMPFLILKTFIVPNRDAPEIGYDPENGYYCGDHIYEYEGGMYQNEFGNCLPDVTKNMYVAPNATNAAEHSSGKTYNDAHNDSNWGMMLEVVDDKSGENHDIYLFDYKIVISTATGIFIAIMYLNFCIDLAIRAVKLGFLQLIAPIPIISMIDPKSAKNGMMSKWVKNCMSTYLGLFIRIAAVNFVIYVIGAVINSPVFGEQINSYGVILGGIVNIVIIIGALMFAKELPKLISDITGIDLKGDFKLNPLKRAPQPVANAIGTTAKVLTGGVAAGALGGVAGAAAGLIANQGIHKFTGLGGGFLSGMGKGIATTAHDKGKHAIKHGMTSFKDVSQQALKNRGTSFFGRHVAQVQQKLGYQTLADKEENELKVFQEFNKYKDTLESIAEFDKTNLTETDIGITIANNDLRTALNTGGTKGVKDYLEHLRNSGASTAQLDEASKVLKASKAFVIDNPAKVSNEQISSTKQQLRNYITRNSSIFVHADTNFNDLNKHNGNFEYKDLDAITLDVKREISRKQADSRRDVHQANREAYKK